MGVIYLVKNKVNNKIYFGQTIKTFEERYRKDFPKNTHNEHIRNSIKKYGWENFEVIEEFDTGETIEELNELEEMYIKMWSTNAPEYGYNKQNGGRNGTPTEETRKKMSEARMGVSPWNKGKTYHQSPEVRERAKLRWQENKELQKHFDRTGTKLKPYHVEAIKKANTGKIVSEETRKKLSKAQFDENGKAKGNKRVKCLDNGIIYDSVKIASQTIGIPASGIAKCCRGEFSQTRGYHFCYVDEETPQFVPKEIPRQVYCFETDEIYEGYSEASRILGLQPGEVRACCTGVTSQAGEYHICHLEDKDNVKIQKIYCITNGKIYNTAKQVAMELGLNATTVTHCCRGRYKQTGGYSFKYIEEEGESHGISMGNVS